MTYKEAMTLMGSSKNAEEWNKNCDTVKAAHGGKYPSWWTEDVIEGGLLQRTRKWWVD